MSYFIVCQGAYSQEIPPIQNFSPAEYGSESQNWAISQGEDKTMFIANNNGLLKFNGALWTLYPSPNGSIIRSVKVVGERAYIGCYMEFGYWESSETGALEYTSLSRELKQQMLEDEEFWSIIELEGYVVFQSHSRIYIHGLDDNSLNVIKSDSFLPKMFQVGTTIYFQKVGEGIFKIENGRAVLVYAEESIMDDEIINIFPIGRELLILTKNKGFFQTQNQSIAKWNTEADDLLSQISLYSGLQLRDGDLALGTISHGLVLLDQAGELVDHIDQVKGLQNNTVLALYEDIDGNIWLGLDVGISFINRGSPFRIYPDKKGLVGSVYASAIKGGYLYLGTNQGLFYKEQDSRSDFQFVEGTHGQVWSLEEIDGNLFCGHHTGTFLVENDQANRISDIQGTWKVGKIPGQTDLLLQGNYDGLYVLQRNNNSWQLRNRLGGFDHSARYFEVFKEDIFVNHEYKGVFRLRPDANYSGITIQDVDTLIKDSNSGILKYGGDLLYAYKKGILKYNWDKNKFDKDSVLSRLYSEDEYVSGKMVLDQRNGHLWTFSNSSVGFVLRGGVGSSPSVKQIPLTEDMRNGIIGYESATALDDHTYLFGARSGYLTVDIENFEEEEFFVSIETIRQAGKNLPVTDENLVDQNTEGDFLPSENNLEFTYFVPSYNKYIKPQYQYQLEGIYPNWSDLTGNSSVAFENLPPGSYIFNVRAKIGERSSENIASYGFTIARPWYRSNLFLIIYLFAFILGSIAIHNAYRRYYHRRQQKLIEKNQREMALAKAQNEKEIIKLKNQQLKEDFKNKSNELAASTMSIIKKNELLSKVKEQLVASVDNKDSVQSIIGIIDKSLKQNDDWELFKEAFNNADRKFLKKLKNAHPNLSPNDIRLCAYLRLNLSSKEIAPMFNISPRSVEIKRYRLRKKMNLTHDDNLVDYILKL
ncbi:helix-turn-helix and ligand-binding sensor domain-containing protein [Flagellimonas myxillae]|uniref:helix-turn-helix and ligand-binding sensor domain-containing protein n=1 Tax=Flagellimonas myxillae TaxID=2942214 RepID=UPI00201F857B|nr:triple tyrosine motif-containing protein [Muricauda myxillae]MCL6266317.1 LuxR C-terminal-related transcriptional regulator [Muricauda myxillae]